MQGIQELITYRVNFILYRIGDVMGAFVAFISGRLCLTPPGAFDSGLQYGGYHFLHHHEFCDQSLDQVG